MFGRILLNKRDLLRFKEFTIYYQQNNHIKKLKYSNYAVLVTTLHNPGCNIQSKRIFKVCSIARGRLDYANTPNGLGILAMRRREKAACKIV